MKTIRENILWIIEHREGGNKKSFADKLGVKTGYLNNIVQGSIKDPKKYVGKICEIWGVSEAQLYGFEPIENIGMKNKPESQPQKPEPEQKQENHDGKLDAIINLLEKSYEFHDRYLRVTEQQQEVINNLSDAVKNLTATVKPQTQQEEQQEKIGGVRKAPRHLKFPEQSPRER